MPRRFHTADNFNPRPREEGDINSSSVVMFTRYFNPRPREEGDNVTVSIELYGCYFNPRPREEGDRKSVPFHFWLSISIHALVKRATVNGRFVFGVGDISIHALVKRATPFISISASSSANFNPRPREEGDE